MVGVGAVLRPTMLGRSQAADASNVRRRRLLAQARVRGANAGCRCTFLRRASGGPHPIERNTPAPMVFNDAIDIARQPEAFSQGTEHLAVVSNLIVVKRATSAVL